MAQLERDAALYRVSRLRRWAIGGAAALTAGFAALVWAIAPGHSLGAARSTGGHTVPDASHGHRTTQLPPLASPSQLGLQGPSSGPQSAPAPTQQAPPAPTQQAAPPPAQSGATSGGS